MGTVKRIKRNGTPVSGAGLYADKPKVLRFTDRMLPRDLWLKYTGNGWEGSRLQKRKPASRIRHLFVKISDSGSGCSQSL